MIKSNDHVGTHRSLRNENMIMIYSFLPRDAP